MFKIFKIISLTLASFALCSVAFAVKSSSIKAEPARVRIQLDMTPFEKVVLREPSGSARLEFRPSKRQTHTLRARLNRPNHFYFGDWHVESKPLKWKREDRRYEVQLSFYRIYGAARSLEESVGHIIVRGHLVKQSDRVYNLVGTSKAFFRNLRSEPQLKVVAGVDMRSEERLKMAKKPQKPDQSKLK